MEEDLAGAEIAALESDVFAWNDGFVAGDGIVDDGDVFLHDDRIASFWERCAGEDPDSVSGGFDFELEIGSGGLDADDGDGRRIASVRSANGVAVHHGVVESGKGDGGSLLSGAAAIQGFKKWKRLRSGVFWDGFENFGEGFGLGDHGAIEAGGSSGRGSKGIVGRGVEGLFMVGGASELVSGERMGGGCPSRHSTELGLAVEGRDGLTVGAGTGGGAVGSGWKMTRLPGRGFPDLISAVT